MADVPTSDDLRAYTDEEFATLQVVFAAEQQRRFVLANAETQGTGLTRDFMEATGGTLDEQAAAVAAVWAQILANCGLDASAAAAAVQSAAK